jgi:hypothetical protein
LVGNEGAGVLGVLAVPALVALIPLLVPSRRSVTMTAVALTGVALVSSASVGIFLIPTVALAWVGVVATRRSGESRESRRPSPGPPEADPVPRV